MITEKETYNQWAAYKKIAARIRCGAAAAKDNNNYKMILIVYVVLLMMALLKVHFQGAPVTGALWKTVIVAALPLGIILLLYLMGRPLRAREIDNAIRRTSVCNHSNEYPYICSVCPNEDNIRQHIYTFYSVGVPRQQWQDAIPEIEAALHITIAKIVESADRECMLIYALPADTALPTYLLWDDTLFSPMGAGLSIVLGVSLDGQVIINLSKTPHILLGGSTGSGKTKLLKLILHQLRLQGAQVHIVDYKGGVDYPARCWGDCDIITDTPTLQGVLDTVTAELDRRKVLLVGAECPDIDVYNHNNSDKRLPHIVVACDEAAEVFDHTGMSKEAKEQITKIEAALSLIARQGRAMGIHLVLSTQRPDAAIIPGQIRSNLDVRICGRADSILSQIILDSTEASDRIPIDAQGRFMTRDGTVFQAYYFDEGGEE